MYTQIQANAQKEKNKGYVSLDMAWKVMESSLYDTEDGTSALGRGNSLCKGPEEGGNPGTFP